MINVRDTVLEGDCHYFHYSFGANELSPVTVVGLNFGSSWRTYTYFSCMVANHCQCQKQLLRRFGPRGWATVPLWSLSIPVVTRLRVGWPWFASRQELSSLPRPDRLWGHTQPRVQWVPGVKQPGREANHFHLYLIRRSRMRGTVPPFLHTSSWRNS
jgi:hypothetical protein